MIKVFFILNRKVTPQKNGCVGCWLLALPRAQTTRLSRILGIWFTYYVPVLINFMTPSKHLSIAYQDINLRRLLRFFFLSKAPHVNSYIRLLQFLFYNMENLAKSYFQMHNLCHRVSIKLQLTGKSRLILQLSPPLTTLGDYQHLERIIT